MPTEQELLQQRRFIQLKDGVAIKTPLSIDFIEDVDPGMKVIFRYPDETVEKTVEEYRSLHAGIPHFSEVLNA